MVWIEEEVIEWKEDNMEATIEVGKKNVVMKFDALLVGKNVEEAEEKIQIAVDNVNWTSFGRYNGIEVTGNVAVKGGSLHYIGEAVTERKTLTRKSDGEELCRFLSDILEFSGIRRWPKGKGSTNELKELVTGIRESVNYQYKIIDSEYNKERLDFLVREELEKFYGDRDLANRNNVTFGSLIYAHNSTYGRVLEKRDIYLEKDNKRYKLITIDELLAALYTVNNKITIEENLFNCDGKPLFIDSGSTITIEDGYNKCLGIIITKDNKTRHTIGYK